MLEPKKKLKVFVYGSLRTGFFNYDLYLKGKVSKSTLGKTKGKLFHMPHKGYPALLDGEDYVYGEIMEIDDYEKVVISMDEMEGYYEIDGKDNEYNRIAVDVLNEETNETEKCYIYKFAVHDENEFYKNSIHIEHGDWKKFMIKK